MIFLRNDIIKTKLKIIEENTELVKKNLPNNITEFRALGLVKDGIYKRIETSIQEVMSICSVINSDLKLGIPANRDDIIILLIENNILSRNIGEIVKEMKGFRNFLVHRYGKIEDEVAFKDIKKGLPDFELFRKEILTFLKKYE